MNGAIVLDKPAGITSFGAIRRVRNLLDGEKVGHIGTLDPLGTGVLPLLVGRATRFAQFYTGHDREYVATIRFGWATTSYDADGERVGEPVEVELDPLELESRLDRFRGVIRQVPPPVSAKKIDGVRAYKLARKKQPVAPQPVDVEIYELELMGTEGACATLRCSCSTGTYVRSLAHDIGAEMGCGAHVATLRRTRVGDFTLEEARTIDELEALGEEGRLEEGSIPAAELLPEFPVEHVDIEQAVRIRHGQEFRVSPFGPCSDARLVKAVDHEGTLLCIGKAIGPRMFHPSIVL